jgi:hypothetical protein
VSDWLRILAGLVCCGGMLLGLGVAWALARMAGMTDRRNGM